jgi:hypothetical protein
MQKIIYAVFLSLLFAVECNAERVTDHLIRKNGVSFLSNENEPFTGKLDTYIAKTP